MRPSNEEIVNAMKVLHNLCTNYGEGCSNCPLCIEKDCECYIYELVPADWEINEPETEWKAYK